MVCDNYTYMLYMHISAKGFANPTFKWADMSLILNFNEI